MKKIKKRSLCGISSALDILGDKWSLLIIRDMIFHKKKSYTDFLNSKEKIATNILADRLLLLESEGIIIKHYDDENKSKFFYRLTPNGLDL
jgi:DNA-binding HxlR family transcriptional regulator